MQMTWVSSKAFDCYLQVLVIKPGEQVLEQPINNIVLIKEVEV